MEDRTTVIAGFILLYLLPLSIVISFIGRKYDLLKKRENSKYDENHAFIRFRIALPIIIKEETSNSELNKIIKHYNQLTRVFWISAIISIPIFFWVY